MKITAQCSSCSKTLAVGEQHAGKKIRCPACKGVVQLPAAAAAESQKPRSAAPEAVAKKKPVRGSQNPKKDVPRKSAAHARTDQAPKKRRRKKRTRESDDIWNQPLSSYGSPAIEEDDYDSLGIPPRKKRSDESVGTNSRRESSSGSSGFSGMGICVILCTVSMGIAIIGAVVGKSNPDVGHYLTMQAYIVGTLLNFGGGMKMLGNAFSEDAMCGFMYLFIPFYALYYLVSRWDENSRTFFVQLSGFFTMVTGIVCDPLP
jgi:phage FluMu protein Com